MKETLHLLHLYFCSHFVVFLSNKFFFVLVEEMEMKIGSDNTSPINDSLSTMDDQSTRPRSLSRRQSSRTILTEVIS